jgi:hypothetical protein
MRNDSSRVEFLAIPVVLVILGILFALMLAADAGVWAWIVVTAALVALGALAVALVVRRHRRPPAFDAPATAPRPSVSGTYRVLVIADEGLTGQVFQDEIAPHAGGRPVEAFVVAPALGSRLARWTGDDSQRNEADRHLAETLAGLEAAGIAARGEVGADDPIQAADDGLREFQADEVVFVTGGGGDANWLEQGVVDVARKRYDLPVSHIEVGAAGS